LQCAGTLQAAALSPDLTVINVLKYSLTSLCVACVVYASEMWKLVPLPNAYEIGDHSDNGHVQQITAEGTK